MDEMSSTEFRRRYASLTSPTIVTVNGHVIGEWRPINLRGDAPASYAYRSIGQGIRDDEATRNERLIDSFNTRPFTPVPKVKR